MLSKVLARSGIPEDSAYITNSLSCRPPSGVAPQAFKPAIEACRPRLVRELNAYPRDLVLALGNTALRSLTLNHNLKITQERGKVREVKVGNATYPVLPTFHPALILRNPGEYPRLLDDVKYAGTLLAGAPIRRPMDTRWDMVTPNNIRRVVRFLRKQEYLAADIETDGFDAMPGKTLCLSVSWMPGRAAVFPLSHPLDQEHNLFPEWRMHLRHLLDGPSRWIWHNGKFDTAFLNADGLPGRVDEDCMLLHYTLNEVRGTHDLGQLGADFLGAPDWKNAMFEEAKSKGYVKSHKDSYANIPPEILYPYNGRDADLTLQLFHALKEKISTPGNKGLVRLYTSVLIPASKFLQEVEHNGLWVSKPYLYQLEREYLTQDNDRRNRTSDSVADIWNPALYAKYMGAKKVPEEFNPGSPQQVKYILTKLGFKVNDTREDTLDHLKGEKHPFVVALLDYRETTKALSTYIYGIMDRIAADGRVHSSYLLHGTTTGRLSSRNPNMQNIPRDKKVRDMFQAPPGKVLIEMDYSQVELRVLAHFSDDDFLKTVFLEGRDLHNEVAKALFGDKFTKEQRVRAKFVNFGIAYGRGADSLVEEFGMARDEARGIIAAWWERSPKADRFVRECRSAPTAGHVLRTPFGRRRRFDLVTREKLIDLQNEAANFPIQSTASDLTLLSAMSMRDQLVNRWEAKIINLVHDSILIEAPEGSEVEDLCRYSVEVMQSLPGRLLKTEVPFVVDTKVGHTWGELK